MKKFLWMLILLAVFFASSVTAQAMPYYTSAVVQDLGTGRWQYDYTVTNDLSASIIKEFNIYFNPELYQSLDVVVPWVPGWFEQVTEPAPPTTTGLQDGFFNAIADPGSEIGPLASLGGFSVSFQWLGFDTPLANDFQRFDFVAAPYTPVPEPGTFLLLGAGIAGLAVFRRMSRSQQVQG